MPHIPVHIISLAIRNKTQWIASLPGRWLRWFFVGMVLRRDAIYCVLLRIASEIIWTGMCGTSPLLNFFAFCFLLWKIFFIFALSLVKCFYRSYFDFRRAYKYLSFISLGRKIIVEKVTWPRGLCRLLFSCICPNRNKFCY